jgi:putative transposase
VRQRLWAEKVHRPLEEDALVRIRRSTESGLPYGDAAWVRRLANKLDLDLTIRPRGRPRRQSGGER